MGDGGPNAVGVPARFRARGGADRVRTLYFIAASLLAALIPLILFAGLWIRAVLDQSERDLQAYLTSRAAFLADRIDTEIEQQFSILRALASAQNLDEPDLPAFEETAARMVDALQRWTVVGLIDPVTGRQLASTPRRATPEPFVTAAPEVVRRVAEQIAWWRSEL